MQTLSNSMQLSSLMIQKCLYFFLAHLSICLISWGDKQYQSLLIGGEKVLPLEERICSTDNIPHPQEVSSCCRVCGLLSAETLRGNKPRCSEKKPTLRICSTCFSQLPKHVLFLTKGVLITARSCAKFSAGAIATFQGNP